MKLIGWNWLRFSDSNPHTLQLNKETSMRKKLKWKKRSDQKDLKNSPVSGNFIF